MDRIITRISIVLIAVYFLVSYACCMLGVDVLTNSYVILFEACVVSYTFCSGSFHCKHMRWTALSVLLVDVLNHTDYYFDYIPVVASNLIPIAILALGMGTSLTLAVRHFIKVIKLRNERERLISNQKGCIGSARQS